MVSPFGFGKVADGIGGFAGLFSLNTSTMKKPTLVASTDGIGTKLLLGLKTERIHNLGQDLVAMCVNDLYTVGAVPLFFLDYFATGQISADQFKLILSSIKSSCAQCGMALLGGETAEMPGLYAPKHFDLAGFVVGVVDEEERLGPHRTRQGDLLIAFKSSGFHSNGYSLIRSWLSKKDSPDLTEQLMTPTKLYAAVPDLIKRHPRSFHALANITGGGISGNLPRVLGADLSAKIAFEKLPTDDWMRQFIRSNGANEKEVESIFNLGAGMIAIVDPKYGDAFMRDAQELGLEPHHIGDVTAGRGAPEVEFI
jgi:phosphoribosylformylglycinamidine cyclo-ligase